MVPAMLSALACVWQGNNQGSILDGCPLQMPSSLLSSYNAHCSGHRSPIPPEEAGRSGSSRQGGRQRQGAGELQVEGVGTARGRAAARRGPASGRLAGEGRTGSGPCGAGGGPCPATLGQPRRAGLVPARPRKREARVCSRLPRKAHPSSGPSFSGLLGHRLSPNAAAAAAAAEPGRQGMGL